MIVTLYSDASTLPQQENRSGIGVVVTMLGEIYKTVGMYVGKMNNIDAELMGILIALKEAREIEAVDDVNLIRICCDCIPAMDLACGDTSLNKNSSEEAAMILEKIDELTFLLDCPIEYQWVRAHNGNHYNEMADELAYEHAHKIK